MLAALRFLELLSLGLWLGAMVFLAFFVAPAAFAVLATREQAGNLVGFLLPRLYVLGIVCGIVFGAALVVEQRLSGGGLRALVVPLVLVGVTVVLILLSHFWLGGQLAALRAEMTATFGSVDQTPVGNALRQRFGRLHGFSSLLLTAEMLLVLALLALTARRLR
jgi:hypothetical protein